MAKRLTREESKALTRERLLTAARKVFLREGFHAASLEQVAAEAGFTKGAVYSAFDSKADLFLALLDRRIDERIATAERVRPAGGDPGAWAAAMARQWVKSQREDREWSPLVMEFRIHAARDPQLNRAYRERHERNVAAIAEVYRQEVTAAAGALSDDDIAQTTRIQMALANGFALETLTAGTVLGEEAFERATVLLAEAALDGQTTSRARGPRGRSARAAVRSQEGGRR